MTDTAHPPLHRAKSAAQRVIDDTIMDIDETATQPPDWAEWRRLFAERVTLAVIKAVREPSPEVLIAGINTTDNGDGRLHGRKWRAMVDALLVEEDDGREASSRVSDREEERSPEGEAPALSNNVSRGQNDEAQSPPKGTDT